MTVAITLNPRYRHLAAAMLASAVQRSEYLLSPHVCSDECPKPICPSQLLHNEKIFEAFDSLVWIWSSASTSYFEAVDRDPDYSRRRLGLEGHVHAALKLASENRALLVRLYESLGRQVAVAKKKKISREDLHRYAESEVEAAVVLLHLHDLPGTFIPGTPRSSEIIRDGPVSDSTDPPPGTTAATEESAGPSEPSPES